MVLIISNKCFRLTKLIPCQLLQPLKVELSDPKPKQTEDRESLLKTPRLALKEKLCAVSPRLHAINGVEITDTQTRITPSPPHLCIRFFVPPSCVGIQKRVQTFDRLTRSGLFNLYPPTANSITLEIFFKN